MTPIGVSRTAARSREGCSIKVVHLDADSTTTDYVLKFLGGVFIGASSQTTQVTVTLPAAGEVTRPDGSKA